MNLLRSLRSETRDNHNELDRLIDVDAVCYSPDYYGDYLLRFERAWKEAEAHIDWEHLEKMGLPDLPRRRQRYESLSDDVANLKHRPTNPSHRLDDSMLPGLKMPAGSDLGMLYVTEGSIHGGSILLARLDHKGSSPPPTRFLRGFGEENGTMWARFIHWLNRIDDDEVDPEHAIHGARHAYTLFIRSFSTND